MFMVDERPDTNYHTTEFKMTNHFQGKLQITSLKDYLAVSHMIKEKHSTIKNRFSPSMRRLKKELQDELLELYFEGLSDR